MILFHFFESLNEICAMFCSYRLAMWMNVSMIYNLFVLEQATSAAFNRGRVEPAHNSWNELASAAADGWATAAAAAAAA